MKETTPYVRYYIKIKEKYKLWRRHRFSYYKTPFFQTSLWLWSLQCPISRQNQWDHGDHTSKNLVNTFIFIFLRKWRISNHGNSRYFSLKIINRIKLEWTVAKWRPNSVIKIRLKNNSYLKYFCTYRRSYCNTKTTL